MRAVRAYHFGSVRRGGRANRRRGSTGNASGSERHEGCRVNPPAASNEPAGASGRELEGAGPSPLAGSRGRWHPRLLLADLTPLRFAGFALVMLLLASSESPTLRSWASDASLADKALMLAKVWVYMMAVFTPVLLAAVATINAGPREGWRRVAAIGAAVLGGQFVGMVLWYALVRVLFPAGFMPYYFGADPSTSLVLRFFAGYSLLLMTISMLAAALLHFVQRDRATRAALDRERQRREETRREHAEARLSMMQAQIEPHFLFNTLASVRRLYETDHASGRAMLQSLCRYLAASLPALRDARATLARELALVLAYLEVHRIRMGARLAVEVDVDPALATVEMPPMMLATLVENAIIHGLGPRPGGGRLRIAAARRDDALVLTVADNGVGLRGAWGPGIGLSNIRTRLASEFGARAALDLVEPDGGGVTAILTLPWPAPATPSP